MILDAKTLPDPAVIKSDVCIVGAGAAGITIARELIGSSLSVALFESGGLSPERSTQALYRGDSNNLSDWALDESRSRVFGGTTSQWSGWCRALDPADFGRRDWIPSSGWPFGIETLLPHYDRASALCEVSPRACGADGDSRQLDLDQDLLITRLFDLSPPSRFGQIYRDELARASNVTTYLHANAIAFQIDGSGQRIETIEFRTLSGKSFVASASIFILATGGVENARLLLASGADRRQPIGNENDLVGRYYMDHLAFFSSVFERSGPAPSLPFYTTPFDGRPAAAGPVSGAITLADTSLRDRKLLGAVLRFVVRPAFSIHPDYDSGAVTSARRIAEAVSSARIPDRASRHVASAMRGFGKVSKVAVKGLAHRIRPQSRLLVRCLAESAPDPENRVTLSEKRDSLGQPRANVRWTIGASERRSITQLHNTFANEAARIGLGVIAPINAEYAPSVLTGASHHIGTTRMHDSPRHGVVDRDCRVHGMANLYIAGSSVFPTCGYANPTLTIIALSIRLADRVKTIFAR